MALVTILALACIAVGLIQAILEETILFPSIAWFVLALAFNTLGVGFTIGGRHEAR